MVRQMTGDHRWDYVVVGPDQGAVLLWQNRCWPRDDDSDDSGGGGDDDDDDEPKCKWGPTDSQGWDGSGAGKWLDDFLNPKPDTEIGMSCQFLSSFDTLLTHPSKTTG
jgi:hypothetical protein